MNWLKKIWNLGLDILFPKICLNCQKYLGESEKTLCQNCFDAIEINKIFFRGEKYRILAAASYENAPLRELIHSLKYNRFLSAQVEIKRIIESYLKELDMDFKDFLVVPVPLHPRRLRERGFNQAEIIGRIVSNYCHVPLGVGTMTRVKNTKPQIELANFKEREENLRNGFEINPERKATVKNRSILLVDDVYTSGSTVGEAAKVLRRAGAREIMVFVLAKAGN